MKKLYLLSALLVLPLLMQANITVRGVVSQASDGEPVIGASVLEVGTSNGTITDIDGAYELTVKDNATLEVSYVGLKTKKVKVTGAQLNIVLEDDAIAVEEVVVTAMGIVQEKKRLNFAVQNLDGGTLNENKSANFVNSLQGKVAGIQVTTGGGSPNSGSQIIIRGITSVNPSKSNEPLMILDGMPFNGSPADINPSDIENVTVLKGAAASALYGQDAAGGVIMVTTKSGEAGKMQVHASGGWQWDQATRVPELQHTYGPGSQGFYKDRAVTGGWGPMLDPGTKIYDNISNFFRTGFYHKYDFSVQGGTDKFTAYASATWSNADGIVPEDYKQRFGALLKASYTPAPWITFNASANISHSKSRSTSGVSSAYSWAITDDITDYQLANGFPRYLTYNEVEKFSSTYSPLYSIYNDGGVAKALRNILNASVVLKPVKGLNITGRVSYDVRKSTSESYTVPRWDDSYVVQSIKDPGEGAPYDAMAEYLAYKEYLNGPYKDNAILTTDDIANMSKSSLGAYSASTGSSELLTADFMASYKAELPHDFTLEAMVGGALRMSQGFSTSVYGVDFIIPGTYSLQNCNSQEVYSADRTASHNGKRLFGYFYEVRADYKGLASLSVTGRWDWSSTIKKNPYFYPSVTAGVTLSELIPGLNQTTNNWLSYWKIRGNYAQVGSDAQPYLYDRRFKQFGTYPDGGYGIDPTMSSASLDLAPEMTYSWEVGMDLRLFNNMTRLDIAYYSTKVSNQIVTVRVSPASGYILQTRNEGDVRNHGLEFTLEQDVIKRKNFQWTLGLNFDFNRGKVTYLPEGVSEITNVQYGDIFTSAYMGGSSTGLTGKDYQRNKDGQVIVDENGYPTINPNKNLYIGNREPLFHAGLTSRMNIYGVNFSFLFDGRYGGDVVNVTGRNLISNGNSKFLEKYRGRQVVFNGVTEHTDAEGNLYYEPNTTPITLDYTTIINYFYNVSTNFIEDGSYLRLSYVSLGYDFCNIPAFKQNQKFFKSLKLDFTCNNVFLLTKYTGTDPLCNASTSSNGTGSAGIDNSPIPMTRSYNLSLSASF